ncbi:uncharacterized protein LOC131317467 [Rhododendron vialii]|uniref:uncharacterized protein LOC131317467 n=1 Tax=Rhododendron vialii TaxID=182163 RepID=UPI00265D7868|nr:uncharacterized protein LOC131317467 [Rhododendron vialii]
MEAEGDVNGGQGDYDQVYYTGYSELCDVVFLVAQEFCFQWKRDAEARGIHWCSWNKMTRAKSNGGLYFPNCSFLEAKRGSRASWAWLSLLQRRDLLSKGLRWQIVTKEELQEIVSIPTSQFKRGDSLVWHHTKNGNYSIKTGYHLAFQALSPQANGPYSSFTPNKKLWDVIWQLNIPHKMRHLWWRASSNSLATKENLMRMRCGSSKTCPICGSFDESIEHLLFNYQWVDLSASDVLKGKQLMSFLGRVVTIVWYIWKSRNDFVFNYNLVDPENTMRRAFEALHEFSDLRIPCLVHMDNPTVEVVSSHWRAPDHGNFKLNCDVAVHCNGRKGVCVVVLRNEAGSLLDGQVLKADISSPLHGELLAI